MMDSIAGNSKSPQFDEGSNILRFDDPLIIVRGLKVIRGQTTREPFILDVSRLEIPRGLFTSILGESGCGKTTLLMILGLMRGTGEDPDFSIECEEMTIRVSSPLPGFENIEHIVYRSLRGDQSETSMSMDERELLRRGLIGFCLQGGELIPSLSLIDNVAIPRIITGHEDPIKNARNRLKQLGLDESDASPSTSKSFIGTLPGELSGGQKQRGVFARALIHDPPLILLDEPTSALDRDTAKEAISVLKDQARVLGQTTIMVTHDRHLAEEFSDCIVEMDVKGKAHGYIKESHWTPQGKIYSEDQKDQIESPKIQEKPAATKPVHWGQYLKLGLMDALGPVYGMILDLFKIRPRELKDMHRSRSYTFIGNVIRNSFVIVAIGLLILLLRGMRSGLIEDFREDLTKSPTARELTITPLLTTGSLNRADLDSLAQEHDEIEMVIPSTTHIVFLSSEAEREQSVTVVGTTANDPLLSVVYKEQDFTGFDENAVVLSSFIAKELEVAVDSQVTFWVGRVLDEEGRQKEYYPAHLRVSNIIGEEEARTAFVHLSFAEDISDFKAGRPVVARDWPGRPQAVVPRYTSLLLFGKAELTGREMTILNGRGLVANPISMDALSDSLYGLVKNSKTAEAEKLPPIFCYRLMSGRQEGEFRWLDQGLLRVEKLLTDCDGIIIPWNEPIIGSKDESDVRLIGFSASIRWLRKYLKYPRGIFSLSESSWELTYGERQDSIQTQNLNVTLNDKSITLPVDVHIAPPEQADASQASQDSIVAAFPSDSLSAALQDSLESAASASDSSALLHAESTAVSNMQAADSLLPLTQAADSSLPAAQAADSLDTTATAVQDTQGTYHVAQDTAVTDSLPACIVPAAFLANLWMWSEDLAEPDADLRIFREASEEHVYYRARIFVHDVYQVVKMHERLTAKFAVRSNQARVKEIQTYHSILDYLVNVLSVISVVIAFTIVWMVFKDVSERKMRMIGTLRIMGLPKRGVLLLLIIQGILVAFVASILLLLLGTISSFSLNLFLMNRACVLGAQDFILVILAIIAVCVAGTWIPAKAISKVDPVVALEQAQQRG